MIAFTIHVLLCNDGLLRGLAQAKVGAPNKTFGVEVQWGDEMWQWVRWPVT